MFWVIIHTYMGMYILVMDVTGLKAVLKILKVFIWLNYTQTSHTI